jgi:hypothetical protein
LQAFDFWRVWRHCLVFGPKQHIIVIFSPPRLPSFLFSMLLLVIFLLILTIPLLILPLYFILLFTLISPSSSFYRYSNYTSPVLYVLIFMFLFRLFCLILFSILLLVLLLYLIFLLLYVISASRRFHLLFASPSP